MNKEIDVSIVMPVYNSGSLVLESIKSVLNQTYQKWELIIINDCSTDNSFSIINENIEIDSRINIITNIENLGPLVSRNIGIKYSKGRFVAFLDQDDVWHASKLELQVRFMLENGFGFTYTAFKKFTTTNNLGKSIIPPKIYNLGKLFTNTGIALSSVVYDKHICGIILFAPDKPYTEFSLYLRLLSMVKEGHLLPDILLFYRVSSNSMSSNKFKMAKMVWNNFENCGFDRFITLYFFINYAFNAVRRYFRY